MSRQKPNLKNQSGAAIIVALFVMSLVATMAIAMMARLHMDIRRTELLLNADSAYLYAQGSVDWAIDTLQADWKQPQTTQRFDKTPIQSPADRVNGFTIQSTIYDAQALFNLNNLAFADMQNDLLHLLKSAQPNLSLNNANDLAAAIFDWTAPPTEGGQGTAFAGYYANLTPAYKAPHRLMVSPSEARLVKGMNADLFTKLLPYVIALPSLTAINVNTAPAVVLTSLSPMVTLPMANAIVAYRQANPFMSVEQFLNSDLAKNKDIPANKVTVLSNYFLVKTSVKVGQQQFILYTLLARIAQGTKSSTTVLWQTKGAM